MVIGVLINKGKELLDRGTITCPSLPRNSIKSRIEDQNEMLINKLPMDDSKMLQEEISHFQSVPWVANLLQDPSFITIPFSSRQVKSSGEDSLFSNALNSPTTISTCLMQYRNPSQSDSATSSTANVQELRTFFTLGPDLNGYQGTLHGGIVTTLIDECMGLILMIRGDGGDHKTRDALLHSTPVTAYLNTRFLRPVSTPGTIVVEARLKEVTDNRKWKITADVRDGTGQILASGECLYVRIRAKV